MVHNTIYIYIYIYSDILGDFQKTKFGKDILISDILTIFEDDGTITNIIFDDPNFFKKKTKKSVYLTLV